MVKCDYCKLPMDKCAVKQFGKTCYAMGEMNVEWVGVGTDHTRRVPLLPTSLL